MAFDPFGDHATRGYLRNFAAEADPERVRRLEHHSFAANVLPALRALEAAPRVGYVELLATHKTLFGSVYPWAGEDRATLAPTIAIAKAGIADLFAHPQDVRRAAEYALGQAADRARMRKTPGEIFGLLAYAHPFLDGNGRTILTTHADLSRRAGFYVAWQDIPKEAFLRALTDDLRQPGRSMDALLAPHVRTGAMPMGASATRLLTHAELVSRVPSSSPSP